MCDFIQFRSGMKGGGTCSSLKMYRLLLTKLLLDDEMITPRNMESSALKVFNEFSLHLLKIKYTGTCMNVTQRLWILMIIAVCVDWHTFLPRAVQQIENYKKLMKNFLFSISIESERMWTLRNFWLSRCKSICILAFVRFQPIFMQLPKLGYVNQVPLFSPENVTGQVHRAASQKNVCELVVIWIHGRTWCEACRNTSSYL